MAHPPRTGTQKALRITSIIMIIFGVLVALSGAIIIASGAAADSLGLNDAVNFQGTETTAGILTMAVGILVLIMGALQLIVAFLGLRASNDASKVGPYRALSWGISIVILAMIVYNWFLGGTFLDDPFLLIGDVVYLLVCTTLADVVKKEHDRGIVGEAKAEVERSGSQKALRVISIVLVVFAVISIVLGLAFLALIAAGLGTDAVNAMDPNDPDLVAGIAVGLVLGVVLVGSGVVDLVVGALGLRGARDPRKVPPNNYHIYPLPFQLLLFSYIHSSPFHHTNPPSLSSLIPIITTFSIPYYSHLPPSPSLFHSSPPPQPNQPIFPTHPLLSNPQHPSTYPPFPPHLKSNPPPPHSPLPPPNPKLPPHTYYTNPQFHPTITNQSSLPPSTFFHPPPPTSSLPPYPHNFPHPLLSQPIQLTTPHTINHHLHPY